MNMMSRRNKRSILSENRDGNLSTTNKNSTKRARKSSDADSEIPSNIFIRLVSKAGITFSLKGNKIDTDPLTFRQKFTQLIESRSGNIKETIEVFCKSLEDSIDEETFFISCLMPTELSVALSDLGFTSSQVPNSIQVGYFD